jgi:hypothetical protein
MMGSILHGQGFRIARDNKDKQLEAITYNLRNYGAPYLAFFDIVSVGIHLEDCHTIALGEWVGVNAADIHGKLPRGVPRRARAF